jgi:xylan 1,4-beta-xylosidase
MPGPDAAVDLALQGLPGEVREAKLTHYRIDEHHSNAYAAWKRMGSPIAPSREQYGQLEAASRLSLLEQPRTTGISAGTLAFELRLPRQAVSLVVIDWE